MPQGAALEPRRLLDVRDLLAVVRRVRAYLRRDPDRYPILAGHAETLAEMPALERPLGRALDETGQVRDEASPELSAARRAAREIRAQMEARLLRLVRDPDLVHVVSDDYVTVRNGRFVVPVRTGAANTIPGVIQDRSASGETVFLEPLFAVELNNRLVLATKDVEAEERRVRAELTDLVRDHAEPLAAVEAGLAALDALAAAAEFATVHGCTRPLLGAGEVVLGAARHPLLLVAGRTVVPVDLRVPSDRRGLAITGPNAGGKTVALKTLGLCVLMAQAGLFVPAAEGSRLPWFDAVLADIGDEQSIDRDLSTFTGHVENLARVAATVGRDTLVLLDEPGAGTDPIEGAALAVGLLEYLLGRGPRVVFTSHFPQVKTFALGSAELDVAAFDVDGAGAPRFALSYHSVGQSLALPIARRHGLPAAVLERAEHLLAGESRDLARAVARLEETRRAYEARRQELERERAALVAARAETEALATDLRARQRRRWADDLEASRHFLRDLETRGRAVLDELRRRPEPAALREFVHASRADVAQRERALAPEPRPPGRAPVPGDTVEVSGHGIRGELVEVSGDRARIRRGGLRFEVAADQLRVVAPDAARERVAVEVVRPAAEVPSEIVLVGQRTREAVGALEAFLDRAVRAGLPEVRVVHGVGTGALRRAIHDFLSGSAYCSEWHEADPGAGGPGVTIARLF